MSTDLAAVAVERFRALVAGEGGCADAELTAVRFEGRWDVWAWVGARLQWARAGRGVPDVTRFAGLAELLRDAFVSVDPVESWAAAAQGVAPTVQGWVRSVAIVPVEWFAVFVPAIPIPAALQAAGSDSPLPAAAFEWLAQHPEREVRACVALHPHLPTDLHRALARDTSAQVRAFLAERPGLHTEVATMLVCDRQHGVARNALNYQSNVDASTLRKLAGDPELRSAVLGNPRCPVDLLREAFEGLDRLVGDERTSVGYALASNPRTPEPILRALLGRGHGFDMCLAGRPVIPEGIFRVLAAHRSVHVRAELATYEGPGADRLLGLLASSRSPVVVEALAANGVRAAGGADGTAVEHDA